MRVFADILSGTIIFAVPLILVALGGMFSERSGIINIALEGIMIIGALASCLFLSAVAKNSFAVAHPQFAVFIAVLIAGGAGSIYSLLLGVASINLKADQTIGGTSLNMLAPAFAIVLTWAIQGAGQTTINIPSWVRITQKSFGFAPSQVQGFFELLVFKSFYLTTIFAVIFLAVAVIILYYTKFGLRLRSCGEHPQAADSVGINVYATRYAGVAISGLLGGIGGLAFTVAVGSGFQSDVAGYGFLALAVMIFGNWKPLRIALAALLFALFKVIGPMAKYIPFLPSFSGIRAGEMIYLMLPYIVTMIILAFTSKRSRAPKAEGIPYDKAG